MVKLELQKTVRSIREASRSMIRELGMLGDAHASLGITNSQVHALVELEREGALGVVELAERLCLEKSSVSRLVDSMQTQQWIKAASHSGDGRRKILSLTAAGEKKLAAVHAEADDRVERALRSLSPQDQKSVLRGLDLYASALRESANKT